MDTKATIRHGSTTKSVLSRENLTLVAAGLVLLVLLVLAIALQGLIPQATSSTDLKGADLFCMTRVWTVHLTFSPDQWEAMQPQGGFGPFGGGVGPRPLGGPATGPGPPGKGGSARPGIPGGPPPMGGPAAFGPSLFVAPVFLRDGDENRDGRLSREEFLGLGSKWFSDWDKQQTGKLDAAQLRAGLNTTLAPPGGPGAGGFSGGPFGPPGGGTNGRALPNGRGGGPPGPRPGPQAQGGRMFAMSFQGADGKRNGVASVMGIEFPSATADLAWDDQRLPEVSVRYKGNGTYLQSAGSPKISLKVDLNDHRPGRRFGGVTKLNFHNNVTDASWMNEVLSYRLFRDAGVPASRTSYARVYVAVPGKFDNEYLGLYSVVENVDNRFARDRFGTKKGVVLKPVATRPFEDMGDDWADYQQAYDAKTPVSDEETHRIIAFCKLVSHASDAEFAAALEKYVDLDEFARFMAVTAWLSTFDSILGMAQNYVVYLHPVTHKFQFIPWDLDHSFGQFYPIGTPEQRENLSIHQPWSGQNHFLERAFAVDKFKRLYLAHMRDFSETIFRPERIHRQVNELAAAIRPAVEEESTEKLASFDRVIAGEPAGPPGPFGASVKPIKGFVTARAKSVEDQLAGTAEGVQIARVGLPAPGGPGDPPTPGGAGAPPFAAPPFPASPVGPPAPGGPIDPQPPRDFGPGMFWAPVFMAALDTDNSGEITNGELADGFGRWFDSWSDGGAGELTDAQLRDGIDAEFSPPNAARPAGFGIGPPPGPPGPT